MQITKVYQWSTVLAEDFFKPWERTANGWQEAQEAISRVLELSTPSRDLAWRGVTDASYALHSSVYRRFISQGGGNPPDEAAVVDFELSMLKAARRQWRFDNLSVLEIMAHIQHYGGPTRLLDVSFNPLVALWFAVEQKFDSKGKPVPDTDGRIVIFDATDRQIGLDTQWDGYELPWKDAPTQEWRRGLPLVWRPPSYNDRIPSQNSAFLIGGVPQVYSGQNTKYRKGPGDGTAAGIWTIDEVRRASSITLSMNSLDRAPHRTAQPTFTLRITAAGKSEIRATLEKHYGLNVSSIYPDLYGLANYVANGITMG